MKKASLFFIGVIILVSCENRDSKSAFLAERDSIININNRQKQELEALNSTMNIISMSLDSIAQQEKLIYFSQEGTALPRRQVLDNLYYFKDLLERQRAQISALQDSLRHAGTPLIEKLNNVIAFLNQQLGEKDKTIQELTRDLSQKNRSISQLRKHVGSLQENISELEQKNQVQQKALDIQNEMLNECYVRIGTRKELQQANLLTGGILRKKVNYVNLNKKQFTKVDIRQFKEININSKRPKILTPMPKDSYRIENVSGGTILHITEPSKFWSVSNYLIIQIN